MLACCFRGMRWLAATGWPNFFCNLREIISRLRAVRGLGLCGSWHCGCGSTVLVVGLAVTCVSRAAVYSFVAAFRRVCLRGTRT
jgi:hypothetical protein